MKPKNGNIFLGQQNHSTCCDKELQCCLVEEVQDEMQMTEFKEIYDMGEELSFLKKRDRWKSFRN